MANQRELQKFELNALDICKDEEYREKLKKWVQKQKEPLDLYKLKKLKDKIASHERKTRK